MTWGGVVVLQPTAPTSTTMIAAAAWHLHYIKDIIQGLGTWG